MDTLQGVIERYTYYNEESGYSIARLEGGYTAVGSLPGVSVGETVKLQGWWTSHPQYGRQFKIVSFTTVYPSTITGITKYLGSGLIKGVGPVTAKRIVAHFKEKTLDVIENHADRLMEVSGVGRKRVDMIQKGWEEQKSIKDIMLFLQSHEVSSTYAVKIYKTYQNEAVNVVREDPYRMTYDIWGIGFKTADKIGRSVGFDEHHPKRVKAGIIYVLNEALNDGHIYMPADELLKSCREILALEISEAGKVLDELKKSEKIIADGENIYLPAFFCAEKGIEGSIARLVSSPADLKDPAIKSIRIDPGYFSDEQLEAIRSSIRNRILILTGGPGTGKTTTLKGIIDVHRQLRRRIMLAAPTGRAAKRMSEVIGMEARTIHRMLEYTPSEHRFKRDNESPLEADLLVIDEVSMIDTILMNSLLKAVSSKTTLILVGDVDQLPSVGAGNVLRDMIQSGKVPVVKLTRIFRQAEQSRIIVNAHRINKGEFPSLNNRQSSDFFFIEEQDPAKITSLIVELSSKRLPARYKFDPLRDIQVLTPMYRGETGATNLNQLLQETLNRNDIIFSRGGKSFRLGDKVLQLRNDYDKEVFNGDMGFVDGINVSEQKLFINFNDRQVAFDFSELDEVTLAYAVTVHKSQGSEYPCVILPLTTSHYMMLQRNLLYTAITRASKLMILIGTKKAVALALKNDMVQNRYTSLMKEKGMVNINLSSI